MTAPAHVAPVDVLAVMDRAITSRPTIAVERAKQGQEGGARDLIEARAAVAELIEAHRQIKHSITQARILGNDWKRELALIENTVDAALSNIRGAS
jgi:hypothetical protein